ncbi:glutamate-5-semialdehyde dehydrogenase [Candidatus Entotheonella palauensis]|uniref:glutamate-5-semialdehyde dehydrogenase n=1 Tax=Candidatus Entotheonella palauensis TaxID=93172 RepID=UPI000B7D07B6|nr:glutamate-5-semialdehyde dehydrogenase [Candidatus Entotheonella palauensis]
MQVLDIAQRAKAAALRVGTLPTEVKNRALLAVADALVHDREKLLEANREDVIRTSELVERGDMARPLLDRLKLSDDKILAMAEGVRSVAELTDPVGRVLSALELDDGLEMTQVTTPLGVIGAIFESRPDAVPQIASLCWKSGNAVIMKGGSEAQASNRYLGQLIRAAIATVDERCMDAVQLVETREDVSALLALDEYIDLFVPRGSNAFVRYIQEHTRAPVLGHADGLCHAYVDANVDLAQAVAVCYDAKVQYPAVCNAIETVLVHRDTAEAFLPLLASAYRQAGVDMRGCEAARAIVPEINAAVAADWETEYLDLIVSIKVVDSLEEAIAHVNRYGSSHTETILTQDTEAATQFLNQVDAATVMHNASTRFADGFRFGKGAEVGISTNKTHARGPVGLDGLVIYKYCLVGQGHLVADYVGPQAKPFTHRPLPERG